MYASIAQFLADWKEESDHTIKLFGALTDKSLSHRVMKGDERTLGRMAWHIATTHAEMLNRTGLGMKGSGHQAPVPATAAEILESYRKGAAELARRIKKQWTDDTLQVEDDMYGMRWARGLTLQVMVRHEIHHRAQMTIVMRQAGLKVPGIYGPSREEWAQYGMQPPV